MGIWDRDDPNSVYAQLGNLENEIGLPAGFCERLREEGDDWSFVIKLHALFEAALTQMLTSQLGFPELNPVIAHIDMGHRRTGKIEFAKVLGLLECSCHEQ
jgi:hypothetical protein